MLLVLLEFDRNEKKPQQILFGSKGQHSPSEFEYPIHGYSMIPAPSPAPRVAVGYTGVVQEPERSAPLVYWAIWYISELACASSDILGGVGECQVRSLGHVPCHENKGRCMKGIRNGAKRY